MNEASRATADHETAVGTLYGELTEPAAAARYAPHLDPVVQQVTAVFADHVLPVAYRMVGDTPADRAVAREAVMSLLITRLTDEIQGAEAALALADEPQG